MLPYNDGKSAIWTERPRRRRGMRFRGAAAERKGSSPDLPLPDEEGRRRERRRTEPWMAERENPCPRPCRSWPPQLLGRPEIGSKVAVSSNWKVHLKSWKWFSKVSVIVHVRNKKGSPVLFHWLNVETWQNILRTSDEQGLRVYNRKSWSAYTSRKHVGMSRKIISMRKYIIGAVYYNIYRLIQYYDFSLCLILSWEVWE